MNLRSDIFLNELTDLVTEIPGEYEGRTAFIKTNIGRARLYGYEFSGRQKIAPWSAVRMTVSYVRGEDVRSHADLPQIPPLQGEIALSLSRNNVGRIDISSSFASAKTHQAAGEVSTSGYIVFDVGFSSVPLKLWQVSLVVRSGVENLFDRDYRNFISTLRGTVRSEPGRNYYLTALFTM